MGSELSKILLKEGHDVVAVDSFFEGLYPQKDRRRRFQKILDEGGDRISFLEMDVLELDRQHLDDVDAVANLAAFPGLEETWRQSEMVWRQNVATVHHLAQLAIEKSLPIVHASTSSVYGEIARGAHSSGLNPVSPYGISKLAAEKVLDSYYAAQGLRSVSLRLFSVYGPGQRNDMAFFKAMTSILDGETFNLAGDGSQSRANTFVGDAAAAFAYALAAIHDGHELPRALDICGQEVVSLRTALSIIERVSEGALEIRYSERANGDQASTSADLEPARYFLNFEPSTLFEEGIRHQWSWMRRSRAEK